MKIPALAFLFFVVLIIACKERKSSSSTEDIDPDIVLVNIEKGDRAFIADLLRAVDSCTPAVIAVDAWFVNSKEQEQDSVLVQAFKEIPHDIVAYMIDPELGIRQSHLKFRSFFAGEGVSMFQGAGGESEISIQPLRVYNNEVLESFELRILREWKPAYKHSFKPGQSIVTNLKRPLEKFKHFDINSVRAHRDELKNKVVILGYLGPDNEDKHFTPFRKLQEYPTAEPDTYGAVIVANTVRTLWEYKRD